MNKCKIVIMGINLLLLLDNFILMYYEVIYLKKRGLYIATLILNLDTGWMLMVIFTLWPLQS
jgi:hypothetical protein